MLKTNPVTCALIQARELIADENNHCRFVLQEMGPHGEAQFCAAGAVMKVCGYEGVVRLSSCHAWRLLNEAAREAAQVLAPHAATAVNVNNFRPHADTMRMFDRAIEMSLRE
jgi:hypothetical protein